MATLSQTKSRRMYSWWWDSHISPKNSKWLQDNLTDVDSKVKSMIKLIEEDADSFARRAEMYYKKRPELMKLVEELYRAYRALAERYDHATVVIRQAHRTMSEAFPNQDPSSHFYDPSESGDDPRMPVHDDQLKTGAGEGAYKEDSDFSARIKELKQRNNLAGTGDHSKLVDNKVRKGLNFHRIGEKEPNARSIGEQSMPLVGEVGESEEIKTLRKALAELEAEKEAGLVQYKQSLHKLYNLESEVSRAQDDYRALDERASAAEAEVQKLMEALSKVEAEKDANLMEYHECLDKVSTLEKSISQAELDTGILNERASKAENEAHSLRDELEKVTTEKNTALDQYLQALEKISNLENRLEFAEEDARKLSDQAEKTVIQIESLKQEIYKLNEEKEASIIQYQQCLELISSLEEKLSSAQEEIQQLRVEVDNGVAKLKGAEEQQLALERSKQSLKADIESISFKVGAQGQELTEKQKEIGRLWSSLQEERMRFVGAETAFQTLQHLHAQTQEELRSLTTELQTRVKILKDVEVRNQYLQNEVLKIQEENLSLGDLNASSAIAMKNMQEEIAMLTETKGKLEQEVELRVDQRNALQQEIYCLKEELNGLNTKHMSILEQVSAVGMNPESLKQSVKQLQDEISSLRETCEKARIEKESLLVKLEILGQLLEKNSILENSLANLSVELDASRGKIKDLEESCQSLFQEKSQLLDEKANILIQLQSVNEKLDKFAERNNFLENSLSDANDELQSVKEKLKNMEDSYHVLADQKSDLASEKDILSRQLEGTRVISEELEKKIAELEARYFVLEEEKTSADCIIKDLQISLEDEKSEHAKFAQVYDRQVGDLCSTIHLLQAECQAKKREFEIEVERGLHSENEIFILKRCIEDLRDSNISLLVRYDKSLEASAMSKNLISQLQKESAEKHNEVKSLSYQRKILRKGLFQVLNAIDLASGDSDQESIEQYQIHLASILNKIKDTKRSYEKTEKENQLLTLQKMIILTLFRQLQVEAEHLQAEKFTTEKKLNVVTEQSLTLQNDTLRLNEMHADLKLHLRDETHRKEELHSQVENLQKNLLEVENSLSDIKGENKKILEEMQHLTLHSALLKDSNTILEEENDNFLLEMLSTSYLSLVYRNYVDEKSMELKELGDFLSEITAESDATKEKLTSIEKKLGEVQMEKTSLQEMLCKSEEELRMLMEDKEKVIHARELVRNQLQEVQGKAEIQELALQSEIEKLMDEIKIWETQATSIFSHLQSVTVSQVLYEQKVHEIGKICSILEHANNAKDTDIKLLHERVSFMASENKELDDQLAAYGPAIASLKECISSLENKTQHRDFQKPSAENLQAQSLDPCLVKDENIEVTSGLSDLKELQNRTQAIEKTVMEMERLSILENANLHSQLEAALKQIDELKSESRFHGLHRKPKSEISEADNPLLMKDIVLDQVSDGVSRRELVKVDNEFVELWPAEQDDHSGPSVNKVKKIITPTTENNELRRVRSMRKKKQNFPSTDSLTEKELGVDKMEVSTKSMDFHEGNNRKVLRRLNSDVQKLTNLHITVQDLKRKLEIAEKGKKDKTTEESDTLKGQLEEAEATILKLFDQNGKLLKTIEDGYISSESRSTMEFESSASFRRKNSLSSDGKSIMGFEDSDNIRRKRISDQARRISEKIGRLQLEVQKIQFVLLKFNDEKGSRDRLMSESKRRVLLRDYLYGVSRPSQSRRKKVTFCACVQPSTRD
ncbi:hypothetical protein Leryth_005498 [Lithospermum erythrorhizon]|nr:hypothetical protein Leryth_005498 [Lithospermum erythrorhizon]